MGPWPQRPTRARIGARPAADPQRRLGLPRALGQHGVHRATLVGSRRRLYVSSMRVDTNFFCTVPMPDAGDPSVAPTARRYGNDAVIACYENMLALGADGRRGSASTRCGSPSTTSSTRATRCCRTSSCSACTWRRSHQGSCASARCSTWCRSGTRCAWPRTSPSPTSLTGGRMEFGVGRGTVPREAWALGTVVACGDNEMSAEHDRINREMFEESMEVIKLAWYAGALRLPRQALRLPARRRARPGHVRQRPDAHPQAPPRRSTSTSRSPRRRRSSTCPGPATRPSTGCRTPTARSRSGTATPRSASEVGTPVGPGRGSLPGAQRPRRPHARSRRCVKGRPGPRRVLQVPVAVRPVHQLPAPGRVARCRSTSSPRVEDSMRAEDPDRRLDRRRRRRPRLLARPARPASTSASSSTTPA